MGGDVWTLTLGIAQRACGERGPGRASSSHGRWWDEQVDATACMRTPAVSTQLMVLLSFGSTQREKMCCRGRCAKASCVVAAQPSLLAALDAGGRLRNKCTCWLACLLAAGGRCVGEQRTSRTWTYLTRCCNTAAAGCCTPGGRRAFRMQLCGRACRNWTLVLAACNSPRVLRR